MLSPRIRSIVTPEGNTVSLEQRRNSPETRDAALQTQIQNLQRSRQYSQQSNQDISQLIGQMGDNLARTREAEGIASAASHIREGGGNTLGALADLGNTALEVFARFQEQQQQRRQAADQARIAENEQIQLENLTYVTRDGEQLLSQAQTMLRDPNVGYAGYEHAVTRFLQQNRQFISNEELIDWTTRLYSPMRDVMNEEANAYFGSFEQIFNTHTNQRIAEYRMIFGGQLHQIALQTNPQEAQNMVNTMTSELMNLITSDQLSPFQSQRIITTLLTDLEEQYGISTEQTLTLQNNLSNMQRFIQEYQQNVLPLQQNGQFAEANVLETQLRIQYGITGNTPFTDPLLNESELRRAQNLRQQGQEYVDARLMDARSLHQFDRSQVLTFALQFFQDPTQVQVWQNTPGWEDNPYIQQAIELADSIRNYENWQNSELPLQINGLNQEIVAIDEEILRLQRSYLQGAGSNDPSNLLQTLSFLGAMNNSALSFFQNEGNGREFQRIQNDQSATLQAIAQQMQQGRASPQQIRNSVQQIINSLQVSQRLIREEARIITNSNQDVTRVLQQWGISSVDEFRTQAATAQDTYQSIVNEILETERQVQQSINPVMPNFNLPQLDTYTFGETEAIVPFRIGTLAPMGNVYRPSVHRFGAPRDGGNRLHAGVDFAIPSGTEIVSYVDGVVERITYDAGGYGHYIVIRSNQDGTRHLFADMSDIPWEVGQRVAPGDLIGLSGTSGNGSAHLHWQIMRAGTTGFGYNDSINPYEYTAAMRSSSQARQPTATQLTTTNAGRTRLVNGYSPSDLASYRTQQGTLGNTGEANFSYEPLSRNRDLRVGIHRTASEIGVPAQWLADVMAYETGGEFSPNTWNIGGAPAVGLIQFYADPGTGGRNGTKTIRGRTYSMQDIARMSVNEQMNLVRDYLIEAQPRGGYQSPYELLIAVWGGASRVMQLRNDPASVRHLSDGDTTFENYTTQLGRHAGRRYTPLYGASAVHTRLVNGCPLCDMMTRQTFVQHEGQ